MAAALSAKGCIVVVASHAADAINGIAQLSRPPDFAVMDFRLETQSGLDALSEVREYLGWCLPALIVTGDSLASDLSQFAATGEAWLIKPVSADDLHRALTRLLSPISRVEAV